MRAAEEAWRRRTSSPTGGCSENRFRLLSRTEPRPHNGRGFLLLALLLLCLLPGSVAAHASLIGTDPPDNAVLDVPPEDVTLSFTEPVTLVEESYRLFGSSGPVATLEARDAGSDVVLSLPDALPDGSYAVAWRVISLDSHPISGTLLFSIGEAGDAPVTTEENTELTPVVSVVQGVGYVALLAGIGLLWFRGFIAGHIDRPTMRLVMGAGGVAVLTHLLLIPLIAARGQGESITAIADPDMWRVGWGASTVHALALVTIGFLLALLFAGRGVARNGVLLGGIIALAALPVSGHTATVEPATPMYVGDLVHGIAGAVWFGGLIGLARWLRGEGRTDPAIAANVVTRFSFTAGIAFAAAAATGAYMAFQILDDLDALLGTTYGRLLLVKLSLLLVPFGLAAWNRLRLVPAIKRAPDAVSAWRRLRTSVVVEAVMLLAVLGVTGFLVLQNPNPEPEEIAAPAASPYEETIGFDGGTMDVRVAPGSTGVNEIVVEVRDEAGEPIALENAPGITLSLPEQELGPTTGTLAETASPGVYAGEVQFPLGGEWEMLVGMRMSRFEQVTASVTVPIP